MSQTNDPLEKLFMSTLRTNFGWMRPISDGTNLIRLDWNQTGWPKPDRSDFVSRETKSQLEAFFSGALKQFDLPLAPFGTTAAGQRWLIIMAKIPYGTVMTYTDFAKFAGKPNAARAAGTSCSRNPIPIIYPCHRVIRSDKTLGNYGGGGNCYPGHPEQLARKAALLKFEALWMD